jgi:protein-tyrosine kinase
VSNRDHEREGARGGAHSGSRSAQRDGCDPDDGVRHESGGDQHALVAEVISLNVVLEEAYRSLELDDRFPTYEPPRETRPPTDMASDEQVDSFRDLRTRLMVAAGAKGLTHFTVLVTGLTEDSGASFVARSLAAAFTMQEHSALLLDCNFRNPRQHDALGAPADAEGLFDYLEKPFRSSLRRLICPTGVPGLYLIAAGRGEALATACQREPFSSAPMKELMARLRVEPCYIVLDGPPIRGRPDARILSELADFVLLVVGYGRSTKEDLAQAAALFDRSKLAGAVFNEGAEESVARPSALRRILGALRGPAAGQAATPPPTKVGPQQRARKA